MIPQSFLGTSFCGVISSLKLSTRSLVKALLTKFQKTRIVVGRFNATINKMRLSRYVVRQKSSRNGNTTMIRTREHYLNKSYIAVVCFCRNEAKLFPLIRTIKAESQRKIFFHTKSFVPGGIRS